MNRTIELKVKGNTYTIEFPTVGKFQAIEASKQIFSKGMYSSLLTTATVSSVEALDMVDIEAYLTVLAPQLLKDLKCESFNDLDLMDYLELKKVYQEQFLPWWNEIMEILSPKVQK